MRDPVMEAFDRVSAARERDHECECNCADKLRDLARELAEAYHAAAYGDGSASSHHDTLLQRARAAGLLP